MPRAGYFLGDPTNFRPTFPPLPPKKAESQKTIFERNSVAAKFRFLYQEAEFFAKI